MSENIKDVVPQNLVKIQKNFAAFRRDVTDRLGWLETIRKQARRNMAAMLVMMHGTAGVYEERLNQLEIDRIVKLEDRMVAVEARLR
ncbi:hypothetical protein [Bosea sp. Root381]|uniref:hypothetical protein n=1 Tax=Bosea sp. Root381 TaxID=1736524 RepID=UPI0012E34AF6|nr:hypothetical protein [Bosea sp. Root381]